MGFKDRDYAHKGDGPDAPWTRAVKWLVIVHCAAYLAAFSFARAQEPFAAERIYETFGLVPERALGGHRFWQAITFGFVHDLANPFALILNMYILWVAGRELEFIYGTARFVRFFFAANLFAGTVYLVGAIARPELAHAPLVGCSGAVMAVLVVYAFLHPGDRILLFLMVEVPVWLGVAIMVALDILLMGRSLGGTLAAGSALSGAAFGLLVHRFRQWFEERIERLTRPAPAPVGPRTAGLLPPPPPSGNLEVELDLVLKKVHEQGMSALTHDEKSVLERASRHYKTKHQSQR